eukprot:scaffold43148_cov25-Tisochrysis_lutea.AAC.1
MPASTDKQKHKYVTQTKITGCHSKHIHCVLQGLGRQLGRPWPGECSGRALKVMAGLHYSRSATCLPPQRLP